MSNDSNLKTRTCLSCGTPADASLDRCPRDGGHLVADLGDQILHTTLSDRYYLKSVIGTGGWGSVYLAEDRQLHRQVAVKVLHPWLAFDRERLARFQREGEVVARLVHPNVCTLYDFGFLNGRQPFIVMEYLEGQTLGARILDVGKLPMAQAVGYAVQACDALAAADALGIVHRDIKPDNILLLPNGQIKLVDFGLAKFTVAEENAKITSTGTTVGTPAYMSPEQCQGIPVSGASDIYSLGCVLFEMLTGKTPFFGNGYFDYMSQHVGVEAPRLADVCHSEKFPVALESAVMRAMEKEPSERFKNAHEFKQALQRVLSNPTSRSLNELIALTSAWRKGKRIGVPVLLGAGGALVLVAAGSFGLVGLMFWESKQPSGPLQGISMTQPAPPQMNEARKRILAMTVMAKLHNNELLDLHGQNIQDNDVDYICDYLAGRQLAPRILSLAGNPIGDDGVQLFARRLNLEALNVSDTQVTDRGVASFSNAPLTALNVRNTRVTGKCFGNGFSRLQRLFVGGPDFQSRCLVLVAKLPMLEEFGVHGQQFVDHDLKTLGKSERLTRLCINDAPITDESLKYLAPLQLRALDIEKTAITGRGLPYFNGSSLEKLIMPDCDDQALAYISTLPQVKLLQLRGSAITDTGLYYLNRMNLEALNLDCPAVSDAAISAYAKAHPQCRVRRFDASALDASDTDAGSLPGSAPDTASDTMPPATPATNTAGNTGMPPPPEPGTKAEPLWQPND